MKFGEIQLETIRCITGTLANLDTSSLNSESMILILQKLPKYEMNKSVGNIIPALKFSIDITQVFKEVYGQSPTDADYKILIKLVQYNIVDSIEGLKEYLIKMEKLSNKHNKRG